LHDFQKVGIANRHEFDEIDGHSKKPPKVFLKSEVVRSVLNGRKRCEFHEEIQIAGGGAEER
jgi:hypothetical protein